MKNIILYYFLLLTSPALAYLTPAFLNANQLQGVNVSATAPTNGQCLVYSSGSGAWQPGSCGGGGGGSPGGSSGDVQFNDSGSFGGDGVFTYNTGTGVASLTGLNLTGLTASKPVFTDGSKNLVSTGTLANSQGGTGGDSSAATGLAKVASGTWSYATLINADVSASAAIAYSKLATLSSGNILVGSAGNVATSVAMSGDATIIASGAVTVANSAVIAKVLTGYSSGAGTVASTDSILQAIQKLNGNSVLKAPAASPAFTTQVTFGNYHLEPCETDTGNSGTSKTVDLSTCAIQKSTLTGNVTYTITNPVTGGTYLFKIVQGASAYTVTWPGTVLWSGGTAPVITATNGKTDLVNLYWDGTSYYGSFSQNY